MPEKTLIELLYGKGAHVNPVSCVDDLSAELAGRTIGGFPHSVWQLVEHMNYWIGYELKRIRGESPAYPLHAEEGWPPPAALTEEEWRNAVVRFTRLIGELAKLAESPQEELSHEVPALIPEHAQRSSTLAAVLWQTMAHNSYHVGQIALLRRAMGAWPPRGGGDTW